MLSACRVTVLLLAVTLPMLTTATNATAAEVASPPRSAQPNATPATLATAVPLEQSRVSDNSRYTGAAIACVGCAIAVAVFVARRVRASWAAVDEAAVGQDPRLGSTQEPLV
jgi:hypothetical protein